MGGQENPATDFLCSVCAVDFESLGEFDDHKRTNDHRIKWLERSYRGDRQKFLKGKHGLSIDVIAETPKVIYAAAAHTIEVIAGNQENPSDKDQDLLRFQLRVIHNGSIPYYLTSIDTLSKFRLLESDTKITIKDDYAIAEQSKILMIGPNKKYDVICTIKPGAIVRPLHIPLLFEFLHIKQQTDDDNIEETEHPFYIGKSIEIKRGTYTVRKFGDFIRGVPPEELVKNDLEKELPLNRYYIPLWFQSLAYDNNPGKLRKRANISEDITFRNHVDYFRSLLWLEELQEELDIQFYSKRGVTLQFPQFANEQLKYVNMIESGLAENRPCVMRKDKVFVCLSEEQEKSETPQWFEGVVHKVNNDSISLGFNQSRFVEVYNSQVKFNVEFVINRYCFQVSQRAVDICKDQNLKNILFPPAIDNIINDAPLPSIMPYDTNISNNDEQLQAVQHIVAGSSKSYPYIIFGPPGTGKTVTVVEAIKQILFRIDKSYVLACAPSNSAADVIAERLLAHFTEEHVFRMYAESRTSFLDTIPPNLLRASNYDPVAKQVYFPPKEILQAKRVIVCTFITASKIASANFPRGHFTHVILDEAGHAMECEALVSIGGILSSVGRVVLAGDPHQLGPVIRSLQAMKGSPIFPKTGLDTSFLERLMNIQLYQSGKNGYNPRFVTKLVQNYRSHPSILKIPNELFYNSELEARGDPSVVNYFSNWHHLPRQGFPLIVHSVFGEDRMEKHSPSYHNPKEAAEIIKYIEKLLDGNPELAAKDIGVITPYRLQVDKLKKKIQDKFSRQIREDLKVGSVEDFQGEERKVILISTVRASDRHLAKDHLFKLGFLKNPKRFNVAITRAQCLVILICCPDVLMLDKNWRSLITYVNSEGGYVGRPYRTPKTNMEELISDIEKLDIRPHVGDISLRQIVEAPAWTRN